MSKQQQLGDWSQQKKHENNAHQFPFRWAGILFFLSCHLQIMVQLHRRLLVDNTPLLEDTRTSTRMKSFMNSSGLADPAEKENATSRLYAFTFRDTQRLVSTHPPPQDMHIFDLVNVYQAKQDGKKMQLFLDAKKVSHHAMLSCQEYSAECYKSKLLLVFEVALAQSNGTEYLFFMESDNDLCVPVQEIERLAVTHKRYFLGTGIGASGWIMSRQFVQDFVQEYRNHRGPQQYCPDCIAANMLVRNQTWSVTRKYYVSHTLLPSVGQKSMNHGDGPLKKHLPRCFEPHRGKWIKGNEGGDMHGWDFFDFEDERCNDADIYPCAPPVV